MKVKRDAVLLHHQQRFTYAKASVDEVGEEKVKERIELPRSKALHPNQILRFFSYGKQSLEVGCFYRGPFFF